MKKPKKEKEVTIPRRGSPVIVVKKPKKGKVAY